jgi:hypothetical protein
MLNERLGATTHVEGNWRDHHSRRRMSTGGGRFMSGPSQIGSQNAQIVRAVYHRCAQNPAAALLEILVHFEIEIQVLPVRYRLLKIQVPDDVHVESVSVDKLPADWPEKIDLTRVLG